MTLIAIQRIQGIKLHNCEHIIVKSLSIMSQTHSSIQLAH